MIIINDEQLLRTPCEPVSPEEVPELVKLLEQELELSAKMGREGIGLAAPQIGIFKQIAIVRLGDLKLNLVNPKIVKAFDKFIFKDEACLSFPGQQSDTARYNEIVISHNFGESFVITGLPAVVCQHEIDHLNSNLFFDKAQTSTVIESVKKASKRVKPNDPCPCGKVNPHTKQTNKYKKCCGQ